MEEMEREEQKPEQNWNGQERRQGQQGEYKGDERRQNEPMKDMKSGDLTGGDAGMSEKDNEQRQG
jgi:hypothetical protein